ncbi:hypothetical protein [Nocardiopsis alba]|uniref:hypothetical protein n=1 Tax=Nocardiopsis alba TaxID=53437 RepID=UPI003627F6B3
MSEINKNHENPKGLWRRLIQRWKALPWYARLGAQWVASWGVREGLERAGSWLKEVVQVFLDSGGPDLF